MMNKDRIVVVMQPTFFPWLGYFDLIDRSDVFVFYNNVQYERRSWQNRNRINSLNGELMITLPVQKAPISTNINFIKPLIEYHWTNKLFKTLKIAYAKSEYFNEVFEWLVSVFEKKYNYLDEFNINIIQSICNRIGLENKFFVKSSDLNLQSTERIEKLIEITQIHNGRVYLSAFGSKDYLIHSDAGNRFLEKNIQLLFHHYTPVEYNSVNKPFLSYMSILDCLFSCGFSGCLSVIKAGRKPDYFYSDLIKTNLT